MNMPILHGRFDLQIRVGALDAQVFAKHHGSDLFFFCEVCAENVRVSEMVRLGLLVPMAEGHGHGQAVLP